MPSNSKSPPVEPGHKKRVRPDYVRTDRVAMVGATPVTVVQLEEAVREAQGQRDAEVARRLSGLELTERLSKARLASWEADLPGKKARKELLALADSSAFLEPPATEIPALAPPDLAAQERMLAQSAGYLEKTIPTFPIFSATEVMARFQNASEDPDSDEEEDSYGEPWRALSNVKASVVYSDGNHANDPGGRHGEKGKEEIGLVTKGAFGPILSMALLDGSHGSITWSHWEQDAAGPMGVFRYRVPETESHYEVSYRSLTEKGKPVILQRRVGYHGEIAIDPVTGTIRRITMVADLASNLPVDRSDLMVEYGPVEMSGKTYNLPMRSVTISSGRSSDQVENDDNGSDEETLLQDVVFGDYRPIGSVSRH